MLSVTVKLHVQEKKIQFLEQGVNNMQYLKHEVMYTAAKTNKQMTTANNNNKTLIR